MYNYIYIINCTTFLYNIIISIVDFLLRVSAFIYAFLNTHCNISPRYICLTDKQINNIYVEICARSRNSLMHDADYNMNAH